MPYESDLPRHERETLQNLLLPGEELRWTGRPIPYYFQKGVGALLGFGLMWTLMCSTSTYLFMFTDFDVPAQALLFTIPFHLAGLLMMCAPLFTHHRSKKVFYALTDQRAIVVHPGFFSGHNVHNFDLTDDMVREQRLQNDGRGDLVFGYVEAYRQNNRPVMRGVGFLNIPDMKAVETLLYNLLQEGKGEV